MDIYKNVQYAESSLGTDAKVDKCLHHVEKIQRDCQKTCREVM